MPVQIGASAHNFDNPTGLMSDCHRRIEMFLGALQSVGTAIDHPLSADVRRGLDLALRYFRDAAPKHTADEEQSLFPRLQRCRGPEFETALATIENLKADHRRADFLHQLVDALGRDCLQRGRLSPEDADHFRDAVAELASIYRQHIEVEDKVLFPLASRSLSAADLEQIGREMAGRRKSSAVADA